LTDIIRDASEEARQHGLTQETLAKILAGD